MNEKIHNFTTILSLVLALSVLLVSCDMKFIIVPIIILILFIIVSVVAIVVAIKTEKDKGTRNFRVKWNSIFIVASIFMILLFVYAEPIKVYMKTIT